MALAKAHHGVPWQLSMAYDGVPWHSMAIIMTLDGVGSHEVPLRTMGLAIALHGI